MGTVVGEPTLRRDRKRPKCQKASYYIYWTDSIEGSKEKSTGTNIYSEALRVFDKWRLRKIGVVSSRVISEVFLDEVLEYYHNAQISRSKSVERLESSMKRLTPYWGDRPASVVNTATIKDYEKYRFALHDELYPNAETISINTIRRELVDLRSALNRAKKDRLIDREVFVELPAEVKKGVEYFSCEDAIGLLRMSPRVRRARYHLPLFLWIGFLTGRRKEAILDLKWSDVDFDAEVIGWMHEGKAETKKRRPIGRLPRRLKAILQRYRQAHPNDEFVISYQGGPIKDIKASFAHAVELLREEKSKDSGGDKAEILQVAYPHMMRHSCATWLMQKGTDRREACQFLGMTEDTLERRYWHHHPDFQRGAADAF